MEISLCTCPRVSKLLIRPPNERMIINPRKKILCRINGSSTFPSAHGSNVNFYDMLCLGSEKAGLDEIKKAYRSMALQFHPDVCPANKEESTRRFVELQKAYETLSNPESRERYDYELGLTDSPVSFRGKGGVISHVGNRGCSRRVLEDQLDGLRRRSELRMKKKKNKNKNNE